MGLWALDERRDRLERAKAEGREQGRAEGRKEGQTAGREEGKTEAVNEYENKLSAARERAKAEGIDLDRFLNP